MKALNQEEIKLILDEMSLLSGAELQKVSADAKYIMLQFWKSGPLFLLVSVLSGVPFVYMTSKKEEVAFLKDKKFTKPLGLFLKTHFFRKEVSYVGALESYGRVLRVYFSSEKYIELRLFSGGANLSATVEKKSVYLKKPLDLLESIDSYKPSQVRTLSEIKLEIQKLFQKQSKIATSQFDKTEIAIKKIKQAIEVLEQDLYLKLAQNLESQKNLSEDLKEIYNQDLSIEENINKAYQEHKKKPEKIKRLKLRLEELIEKGLFQSTDFKTTKDLGVKALVLDFGKGLRAYCGKSAKDNAKLLREAKPWYLWMHLKDYPSGHLIVAKNKSYELSDSELETAALFLFAKGAPKKLLQSDQIKFEVMFTERRHIRPIKGAKAGLVQTTNFKTRVFRHKS